MITRSKSTPKKEEEEDLSPQTSNSHLEISNNENVAPSTDSDQITSSVLPAPKPAGISAPIEQPPQMNTTTKAASIESETKETMTTPETNTYNTGVIVTDNDVLCGRGGGTHNHPGNRSYRNWVQERKSSYSLAPNKAEKSKIAREVLERVRSSGGRFLQRNDDTSSVWTVVEFSKALSKTSQALREGAPSIRAAAAQQQMSQVNTTDLTCNETQGECQSDMTPTKQRLTQSEGTTSEISCNGPNQTIQPPMSSPLSPNDIRFVDETTTKLSGIKRPLSAIVSEPQEESITENRALVYPRKNDLASAFANVSNKRVRRITEPNLGMLISEESVPSLTDSDPASINDDENHLLTFHDTIGVGRQTPPSFDYESKDIICVSPILEPASSFIPINASLDTIAHIDDDEDIDRIPTPLPPSVVEEIRHMDVLSTPLPSLPTSTDFEREPSLAFSEMSWNNEVKDEGEFVNPFENEDAILLAAAEALVEEDEQENSQPQVPQGF